MKTRFLVKGLSIDKERNYYTASQQHCAMSEELWSISMNVIPYNSDENAADLFLSVVNCGRIITLTDYEDYVEPFKEEFKEFLLERYPEKIMSNQTNFNQLFGDE